MVTIGLHQISTSSAFPVLVASIIFRLCYVSSAFLIFLYKKVVDRQTFMKFSVECG